MEIDYSKILKNNMINVFRDVLKIIEKNGFKEDHHLYITFKTDDEDVIIPDWLKEKFPDKMTIIMQHEYWNFKVAKDNLNITLSFNDINSPVKKKFSVEFPKDKNFISLKNWHQFETDNPNTFPAMYNFWVKKMNN